MTHLYERIKSTIEDRICPVHNKKPKAMVESGNVTLICCCVDFEIDCYNEIIEILQEQLGRKKDVPLKVVK